MPRTPRQPAYRLHKARNAAVVRINGQDHYLGPYDSPESHQKYAALINKWRATQGICPAPRETAANASWLTINELILAYWKFAKGYYVKDGEPTHQLSVIKSALHYVRNSYGASLAAEFGPLALQGLQERMVVDRLSRSYINGHTRRIKLMFRWAVSKELVPAQIHVALATVSGLKKGRTKAREPKAVRPVPTELLNGTVAYLPKVVADMVRFQQLTGCRPGEVCILRPCDVDRSAEVWAYYPASHKTEHLDRPRVIFIGPQAQEVLLPYLLRDSQAYCFSPAESEAIRKVQLRERRKSKVQPSQLSRKKARPRRKPQGRYTKDSYARAVARAADRAFGQAVGPLSFDEIRQLVKKGKLKPGDLVRHRPADLAQRGKRRQAYAGGRWLRAGSLAELFPEDRLARPAVAQIPSEGWQYMTTNHRWSPNRMVLHGVPGKAARILRKK